MAIPDFQTIMRPLLACLDDGGEHRIADVRQRLDAYFGLTAEEREARLPSGRDTTFRNRVGWATAHLYRTGLLERPRRSVYRITPRGRQTLAEHPDRIDLSVLAQFPEYEEFRQGPSGAGPAEPRVPENVVQEATPEELIDAAYEQHRRAIVAELLDRVRRQTPEFFEQLVIDVLLAMGYGGTRTEAAERLGRSGDGGIDGIIREDRLGLDVIYIQAKRWEGVVGRPTIQAFVGALQGVRAPKGVLITSSTFSREAREYADVVSPRVILVDGQTLAGYMLDHDVGVAETTRYSLKRIDEDYFGVEDP